jgi:PIN domain nuclease of toxin-antitoxin system
MCSAPDRLSERAKAAILGDRNTILLSVVSWWEIAIKVGIGKLDLESDWASSIKHELRHNRIDWLPVLPEHCERIPTLPFHHRDPFDRLLVAQAQAEGLSVITSDSRFAHYDIDVVW